MKRRLLITGGAGFIGSHLVEFLAGQWTVLVLDDYSTGKLNNLDNYLRNIEII
jgi:nucleoside-diphosphate-sugar epimerase